MKRQIKELLARKERTNEAIETAETNLNSLKIERAWIDARIETLLD